MTYTVTPVAGYNATPPPDDGSHVASNVPKWADVKTKLADPVKDAIDTNLADIAAEFVSILAANQLKITVSGSGSARTIQIPGIKWQIVVQSVTTGSINLAANNVFQSASSIVTWDTPFNSTPFVAHNVIGGTIGSWSALGISATSTEIYVKGMNHASAGTATIGLIAIGTYT